MRKSLFILLALLSFVSASQAEDTEVLNIDRSVTNTIILSFPNDNNVKPKAGDFEIVNYVLMSNDIGERWGVITLTNLSSGNRELDQDHLMALFADGSRNKPLEYKLNFKGKETQSITVSFGVFKFPILSIYTSN
ncbi:hypothetical protein CMT41_09145 [Colwellia sp. MT41]|uniref:hypothetical protein n=1 Tax=unclassified Colwellia TaxID=196834 RepID=UPI00070F0EF7|nr:MULTISPECIES: hypothetical protein [unclassified Colwellia]ALO34863.1 hypothetical protein CMT41_09145 [Colwellia sp. MT41]